MTLTDEKQLTIKLCACAYTGVLGFLLLFFFFQGFSMSRESLEVFSLVTWLSLSWVLSHTLPKGIWSLSFIFFSAFAIFHGGLVYISALNMITDQDILYVIQRWFYRPETTHSIYLVNFTMILYALVVIMLAKPARAIDEPTDTKLIKRLHHIGGLMLTAIIVIFFLVALATGAMSSYSAYLKVVNEIPLVTVIFVYMYMFIGIALVFVAVSYRKSFGYLYFIIFGIWAVVAFKMGLRGEVMFPAAVAAGMLGRRRIPITTGKLAIALVLLLIAIVVVKNARLSGDYSKIDNMNPLNAIAEMGSSLRTVQEVITWRTEGYERLYGASYWAPFERQIALFLPIDRPPAKKDPRLLNVVVQEKAGPIGFSPIAEAYTNFGEKGIILVAVILGLLFAKLDSISSTIRHDVYIGVAIIPLFVMIRNSFTFIPVQIILGLIIAFCLLHIARIKFQG